LVFAAVFGVTALLAQPAYGYAQAKDWTGSRPSHQLLQLTAGLDRLVNDRERCAARLYSVRAEIPFCTYLGEAKRTTFPFAMLSPASLRPAQE